MKQKQLVFLLIILLLTSIFHVSAESGIYVGGHFRRDRTVTVPTLKASGFTYVILFNIQVEPNGDLTTDGETICKNGVYVFATTQPNYVADVMALRQGLTSIRRVETCVGGWGSKSYDNIKALVNSQGTGTNSILYKNFKALKDKIPVIEAINNDDEHTYDVTTAAAFHVMLFDLGFKTTLAPYMNKSFWQNLATTVNTRRAGAVDRIDLQCYEGGAGNNPKDWNINNIKLHAGLLHFDPTATITSKMQNWKNTSTTTGGFLWVYNANDFNLKNYAASINSVFGGGEVFNVDKMKPQITVYSEKNYQGKAVNFEIGKYVKAAIQAQEFPDLSLNSVRLTEGFRIDLYQTADCSGDFVSITSSTPDVKATHATPVNSWVVKTAGDITFANKRLFFKNRKTGLYITPERLSSDNAVVIQQKAYTGAENQKWLLSHSGDGVYRINNRYSNKTFQVNNADEADNALIIQGLYSSATHQRIVVVKSGTDGFYKLMPLHSLKYIAVTSDLPDTNLGQLADFSSIETDWELIDESAAGVNDVNAGLIRIFPNSTKDYIEILSEGLFVERVQVIDLSAKTMIDDKSGSNRLNIQHLRSGCYVCKVWLKGISVPQVVRIII